MSGIYCDYKVLLQWYIVLCTYSPPRYVHFFCPRFSIHPDLLLSGSEYQKNGASLHRPVTAGRIRLSKPASRSGRYR